MCQLSRLKGRKKPRCSAKRGVASVEAAILLPLLVFVTFSSLELSNMIFTKQSLSIASYEGAKIATIPGATEVQARTRVQEILSSRGISNATITVTPPIDGSTPRGTMVVVGVETSSAASGVLTVNMFTPRTLRNQTAMVRQ